MRRIDFLRFNQVTSSPRGVDLDLMRALERVAGAGARVDRLFIGLVDRRLRLGSGEAPKSIGSFVVCLTRRARNAHAMAILSPTVVEIDSTLEIIQSIASVVAASTRIRRS